MPRGISFARQRLVDFCKELEVVGAVNAILVSSNRLEDVGAPQESSTSFAILSDVLPPTAERLVVLGLLGK